MPDYMFTGPLPGTYPHSRDARDIPIGAVSPGDVRDLDEPLDPSWVPAGDEHWVPSYDDGEAGGGGAGPAGESAPGEDGGEARLPRRTRKAKAGDGETGAGAEPGTTTAGETGSEES